MGNSSKSLIPSDSRQRDRDCSANRLPRCRGLVVTPPGFGRAVLEGCFQAWACGAVTVPAGVDARERYRSSGEGAVASCAET